MKMMVWVLVCAAVAGAAEKKNEKFAIPPELEKGMVGEVRSLDITVEEECEAHIQNKAQWEKISRTSFAVDFVRYRFGFQVMVLAGSPEATKTIQEAVAQLAKNQDQWIESTQGKLCKNCAQMKMMGELGNFSVEAVNLKNGAMYLLTTGIERIVPELQQRGREEYDWMVKAVKPVSAPAKK